MGLQGILEYIKGCPVASVVPGSELGVRSSSLRGFADGARLATT